jgi:arylsulfatase A-like enzyme
LTLVLAAWPCFAERLNVLFILTDDQRPDSVGALGSETIRSPHLDRLCQQGMSFTRAYAGYPICYASRAEMLTGRASFTALKNYPAGGLDPRFKTLPAVFQEGGYETWHLGKWHVNGQPQDHGYMKVHRHYSSGGAQGMKLPETDLRGLPLTGYRGWTFKQNDGAADLELGIGLTPLTSAQIADGAVEVIEKLRDSSKPFFLHVNFTAPHDPRLWPEGSQGSYVGPTMPLPPNFAAEHPFDHGNLQGRDETLIPRPLDPAQVQEELAVYAALITDLDHQTGRLLAALERAGLAENTVVIFTSDQGLAMGSHGLMGKQNQYEHSIRAPLILAGPGVPTRRTSAALCYLRDLFPTLCDLCQLPAPADLEARSLVPLFKEESAAIRDHVIGTFTQTQRMIAERRWKWIEYPEAGQRQLFNLANDPHERHNLADDPAYQPQAERLAARLKTALKELGDPLQP